MPARPQAPECARAHELSDEIIAAAEREARDRELAARAAHYQQLSIEAAADTRFDRALGEGRR